MYSTYGKELVPPKHEDVENCENVISGVKINGKRTFLNGDKLISEPLYDYLSDFSVGRTYATKGDETVYVDSKGKEHKEPR